MFCVRRCPVKQGQDPEIDFIDAGAAKCRPDIGRGQLIMEIFKD